MIGEYTLTIRIIAETPQGARATAAVEPDTNSAYSLDFVLDGEPGSATFKNLKMAETAAVRALFSNIDITKLHVRQSHQVLSKNTYIYDSHGDWFQTLFKRKVA